MKTKHFAKSITSQPDQHHRIRREPRRLRVEHLCTRLLLASDMMNATNPLDVNNDNAITASDALVVVNYMSRSQGAEGESTSAAENFFPDTNGDGKISSGDALRVINRLAAEGEIDLSDGDMSVKANGRDVIIKFTGNNVTLNVSTPSPNMLRLTLDEGEFRDVPIRDDFIVDVSGTNLRLNLNNAIIPDDLIIKVSGGNNRFTMQNSIVGDDLLFTGGKGVDFVSFGPSAVVGDLLKLKLGDGNDNVNIAGLRVGDDFLFYGDDGQDSLSVDGAVIGDDAIIRMGDDADQLRIRNVQVHDVADADGGDSNLDVIAVDVATVTARRLRDRRFEIRETFDDGDLET